jgi:serine protease AprX
VEGTRPEVASEIQRARQLTRQQLGASLGNKASDAFCVAVAATRAAGLETLGFAEVGAAPAAAATSNVLPAVVEFAPPPAAAERLPRHVSPEAAEALRSALEGAVAGAPASETSLAALLRHAGVKAARDEFYLTVGPIRDHVERAASAVSAPTAATERIGIAAAPVQACWLNRTVRATADPLILSDVASDPSVERIDLPRRLMPDAVETDVVLEAVAALRGEGGPTGSGVTVGVIDSEVALGHPALLGRVIHRRNYTQEPFGTPGSHGTAVAGIVAARSADYEGIAPDAMIYSYKVLAEVPSLNSTDFEGALAIQHALEDGIRVVNCSWRAPGPNNGTSREVRACNEAWGLGMTIVKSAGNAGPGAQTVTTPADADGVIAVGATDQAGRTISDYSSRGPTGHGLPRPHLVAPGGSDTVGLVGLSVTGGVTDIGQGTSYAAPHVAGLIALLIEREPELLPDDQRERLIAACDPLPGVDESAQGAGLIDPGALLAASTRP